MRFGTSGPRRDRHEYDAATDDRRSAKSQFIRFAYWKDLNYVVCEQDSLRESL